MEDKTQFINNLFSDKVIFEKEILDVKSEKDRSDIMRILSKSIVRESLKEHINFLYIKDIKDFTLKHIINILFKDIASEWVIYTGDVFNYSKEEALSELQSKERVKFIHLLVLNYYKYYKCYIFEEIANTFIELLASINNKSTKIILVNAVINSDLIANRNIIGVNSFDQLYRRVKSAKNLKNTDISYLQVKISEIISEIESDEITSPKKEELSATLLKYEKKVIEKKAVKLEKFDATLQRVKRAIFNSLKNEIFKG